MAASFWSNGGSSAVIKGLWTRQGGKDFSFQWEKGTGNTWGLVCVRDPFTRSPTEVSEFDPPCHDKRPAVAEEGLTGCFWSLLSCEVVPGCLEMDWQEDYPITLRDFILKLGNVILLSKVGLNSFNESNFAVLREHLFCRQNTKKDLLPSTFCISNPRQCV